MLFSIVIPYFNCGYITDCLDSILNQIYHDYEVIIVDNNSSIGYLELLYKYPFFVLHQPIQGSYAARNKGAEHARGSYLVFIDSDCVAEKNWLGQLHNILKESSADMVLGGVQKIISARKKIAELVDRDVFHNHPKLFSKGSGTTANLAVSKKFFEKIGGFSADYPSGGDEEFIRKSLEMNIKYVYAPEAIIRHKCRDSIIKLMLKSFRVGVGLGNRDRVLRLPPSGKLRFFKINYLYRINPFSSGTAGLLRKKTFLYVVYFYLVNDFAVTLGRIIGLLPFSQKIFFKKTWANVV